MNDSPYLTIGATMWCIERGVVIVGYDFYHGNDEPNSPRVFHNSRTLSEHGVITMPYLKNLDRIGKERFTLIGLPLKLIDAEASPIRAVALVLAPRQRNIGRDQPMNRRHFVVAALLLASLAIAPHARAQDQFPNHPITPVAPISPGTAIDILARLYADRLSQILGQSVVVLNKPGAGGIVGAEFVAGANADGYTLLFANSGHSILSLLNKSLRFDPIKDFAGVIQVGAAPAIAVVPARLGVADLKEFIALAKAKPGQLNYGSAGIGTSTHLAGAYFAAQTGIDIVHIPYTVSSNIISDMLSGHIQASFDPLAFVLAFLQNGSLRALAVGADEPIAEPAKIATASA